MCLTGIFYRLLVEEAMNADKLKREAQKFIDDEICLLRAEYPDQSDKLTVERFVRWGWHDPDPEWWDVGQSACSAGDRVFVPGADADKIKRFKESSVGGWVSGVFYESGYYRGIVTEMMHRHRVLELSEDASNGHYCEILQDHTEGGCLEKGKNNDDKYLHRDTRYKLTLGVSQRVFGYYLKFTWCLKIVTDDSEASRTMPPHCPISDITLEAAGVNKEDAPEAVNVSDLNCIGCYEKIIDKFKQARDRMQQETGEDSLSLAEWELVVYNASR